MTREQHALALAERALEKARQRVAEARVRALAADLVACMLARDQAGAKAVAGRIFPGELDAVAAEVWRIEFRHWCRNCHRRDRKPVIQGYCCACYSRWQAWGYPDGGPPDPQPKGASRSARVRAAARFEDFCWLRANGESVPGAGRRVGVSADTARHYEDRRRQQAAA